MCSPSGILVVQEQGLGGAKGVECDPSYIGNVVRKELVADGFQQLCMDRFVWFKV